MVKILTHQWLSDFDAFCSLKVNVRESHNTLSENSLYTVHGTSQSTGDLADITVKTATNIIFDLHWEWMTREDEDDGNETQANDEESPSNPSGWQSSYTKTRRYPQDFTYSLPSDCINRHLEDGFYKNMKLVANKLLEKGGNVVT